ncbi:MAG TPA: hypothetical protein VK363_00395, partial [Pyrinomonadaceae bacterium]|nr:hypothetical protein [Pyrinomonadaceae bacterium]
FTPEQIKAIDQQISVALDNFTEKVGKITGDAIKTNQGNIIKTAEAKITEAVNNNQRIIIAAAQEQSDQKKDNTLWKFFTAAFPVISTAALGFLIWQVQTNIDTKISENNEILKIELSIREEFYKKKLNTYENTHKQMSQLVEALQNALVDRESKSKAIESLRAMYQDYSQNNLYMSNDVVNELEKLCDLGTDLPPLRRNGKTDISQIVDQVARVETKMKEDLHVDEIGKVSEILRKNQPR